MLRPACGRLERKLPVVRDKLTATAVLRVKSVPVVKAAISEAVVLSYEEALQAILDNTRSLPTETVPLDALLGRYLACPLAAKFDLPMFDNSAVDGYGVRLEDVRAAGPDHPVKLKLTGTVSAGDRAERAVVSGMALKIMTGAMVPETAEAVIMREFCEEQYGFVVVSATAKHGENIRRKGEEVQTGATVLPLGTFVTPPVVGLIATMGYNEALVYQRPKVAVVATGDELIEPGRPLAPGQIYDSNSYAMSAAVKALGFETCGTFHARDDVEATRKNLSEALDSSDVVVSAGGVSVGDFDYVKDVFEQLGVRTIFWKIAVKPGKPVYFGILENDDNTQKLVFGLPGNPVSALVTFHQFVRPALLKMIGCTTQGNVFSAHAGLKAAISKPLKKKPGRLDFVRGVLESEGGQLTATPTTGQESHMLSGLAKANCLIYFAADVQKNDAGDFLPIDWLSWFPT